MALKVIARKGLRVRISPDPPFSHPAPLLRENKMKKYKVINVSSDYHMRLEDMDIWADEVSDGYYTITELYEHQYVLFYALCKIYDNYITPLNTRIKCWKSKLNFESKGEEGWFIAGMTIIEFEKPNKQITYHIPISWWNKFNLIELERVPEYDNYTSNEVIKRLMEL